MQPPKGYYKQILPPDMSHFRLAFANVPRHGVDEVSPEPVLAVLDASQDEHAAWYGAEIRQGRIVCVVLKPGYQERPTGEQRHEKVWQPGELFFRSHS